MIYQVVEGLLDEDFDDLDSEYPSLTRSQCMADAELMEQCEPVIRSSVQPLFPGAFRAVSYPWCSCQ